MQLFFADKLYSGRAAWNYTGSWGGGVTGYCFDRDYPIARNTTHTMRRLFMHYVALNRNNKTL